MTIDPVLLRAILAMDAYNQGYGEGVLGVSGDSYLQTLRPNRQLSLQQQNRCHPRGEGAAFAVTLSRGHIVQRVTAALLW